MGATNKAAHEERIGEVYRLLLTGSDRRTIMRYAKLKGWDVKPRTVDSYIREAQKELTEVNRIDREKAKAVAMKKLDDLYYKSYLINDFKTCLAVQKESNELNGLHKETVEHTVTLSDMDLLRRQIDAAISANPDSRDAMTAALDDSEDSEE